MRLKVPYQLTVPLPSLSKRSNIRSDGTGPNPTSEKTRASCILLRTPPSAEEKNAFLRVSISRTETGIGVGVKEEAGKRGSGARTLMTKETERERRVAVFRPTLWVTYLAFSTQPNHAR